MSASTIISTLWAATDANSLTDEQLSDLCCSDELSGELSRVAEAMSGIAGLIAEDKSAGYFQDQDSMSQMLWFFSDVISTSAEISFVNSEAQWESHQRKLKAKPSKKQTKRSVW